jgi:hypothetical protein
MISAARLRQIQERRWKYILGVRMRRAEEAGEAVMERAGRHREVYPRNTDLPPALKVKEVWVEDQRYIVCRNEDQAQKGW